MLPLFPLIKQLNDSVTEAYYATILDEMLLHGYRMVAVYDGEKCLGLSGIWVAAKIYCGRYLEMDNVVVSDRHRSRGIGQLLTAYITDLARHEGCAAILLDAYLENDKGHVFYERQGFVRRGYHFVKNL
ncbi:MAG: GNAT family N-acetyltransferase [Saprospiraceae bacterium]